jgi:hypothetical protein
VAGEDRIYGSLTQLNEVISAKIEVLSYQQIFVRNWALEYAHVIRLDNTH